MRCDSCGTDNSSDSRFCMSCGATLAPPVDAPAPPEEAPVLGDPSPAPAEEAPAGLPGAPDPLAGIPEPTSAPADLPSAPEPAASAWDGPEPAAVPLGAVDAPSEPVSSEPTAASWAPSPQPEAPATPGWEPAPAPDQPAAPAAAPGWPPAAPAAQAPAAGWTPQPAAVPQWQVPAPAAPAPAPAPVLPPLPVPTATDPYALGAAAGRMSQAAQGTARGALLATAAVMAAGERAEAVAQGTYDDVPTVFTLTDRRVLVVDQRDWNPMVTWFNVDRTLAVQAWEDEQAATVVLSSQGRVVQLGGITDKAPAYELVARLRARTGT